MPEEPSVLDYLKSKLKFWERGGKVEIPAEAESPEESSLESPKVVEMEPAVLPSVQSPVTEPPQEEIGRPNHWPWRSLLALVLTLLGQRAWEPVQDRKAGIGLIFYAFGLALLIWAYFSHEWSLSPVQETGSGSDTMRVRRLPLFLGIPLALAAFITLGHNLFTIWNVLLWVLAIICFVWAFWLPKEDTPPFWRRVQGLLRARYLADQGHTLDIARVGGGGSRRLLPYL